MFGIILRNIDIEYSYENFLLFTSFKDKVLRHYEKQDA